MNVTLSNATLGSKCISSASEIILLPCIYKHVFLVEDKKQRGQPNIW